MQSPSPDRTARGKMIRLADHLDYAGSDRRQVRVRGHEYGSAPLHCRFTADDTNAFSVHANKRSHSPRHDQRSPGLMPPISTHIP
jgi:hypothetical protein